MPLRERDVGGATREVNYAPGEGRLVNAKTSPALYDDVPTYIAPAVPREYRLRHSGHDVPQLRGRLSSVTALLSPIRLVSRHRRTPPRKPASLRATASWLNMT